MDTSDPSPFGTLRVNYESRNDHYSEALIAEMRCGSYATVPWSVIPVW